MSTITTDKPESTTTTNHQEPGIAQEPVSDEFREHVWDQFVSFLKKGGHNITETRRIILNAVLSRSDHFRADQLAAQLSSGPRRVSRGSVYRTLALLSDAGIVRALRVGEAHVHYERAIDRAAHHHMICDESGKFIEFESDDIDRLVDQICDKYGFLPRTYSLVIYGRSKDHWPTNDNDEQ